MLPTTIGVPVSGTDAAEPPGGTDVPLAVFVLLPQAVRLIGTRSKAATAAEEAFHRRRYMLVHSLQGPTRRLTRLISCRIFRHPRQSTRHGLLNGLLS